MACINWLLPASLTIRSDVIKSHPHPQRAARQKVHKIDGYQKEKFVGAIFGCLSLFYKNRVNLKLRRLILILKRYVKLGIRAVIRDEETSEEQTIIETPSFIFS